MLAALGTVAFFETKTGRKIRYFESFKKEQITLGTLVIFQGRASYLERYEEVIQFWIQAGYQVFAFDWTGQGGSTRLLSDSKKLHIDTYITYIEDFHEWFSKIVLSRPNDSSTPLYFYAVSMGALIATLYVQEYRPSLHGMILITPCFGINTGIYPALFVKALTAVACNSGFHCTSFFNLKRAHPISLLNQSDDGLFTQGLTFGWLNSILSAIHQVSIQKIKNIKIPVFIVQVDPDLEVDNQATDRISKHFASVKGLTFKNVSHA